MAKVTIDGITVDVPDNANIIQAAEAAGIHVPHLCYHPKLSLSGTCRLCLVEVEKVPKLQTACSTTVRDGMVVFTNNEKVRKARAGVLEFLLINHPLDCPVCDQAGECKLQDYAFEYGMANSRFTEEKREYPLVDIGGTLVRNMNRCVHCKRCIRFSAEIAGMDEYGPEHRGNKTSIGVFPGKKVSHEYTGTMVDICPVGALTSKDFRFKARVWNLKATPSVCPGCSTGCPVVLQVKNNKILRMRPAGGETWILCDAGRFGYSFVHRADRLTEPGIRRGAMLQGCSFEEAVSTAASGLKKVVEKFGAEAVAGICLPYVTNEDALAFHRLMTEVIGTKNHDYKLIDDAPATEQAEDFLRRADHAPNTKGLQGMGVGKGGALSGTKLVEGILKGNIKAVVAVNAAGPAASDYAPGLKDALGKLECLVTIDILPSIFSDSAQVLLPGAAFAEKDGTFTNHAGKVQPLERALRAPKGARAEWETLTAIARAMDKDLGYKTRKDVTEEATRRISGAGK